MQPTLVCTFLALMPLICNCLGTRGTCESPQYLELYKSGTIKCFFHENFFGVLWYNTSEYSENDPILDYQNMVKTGVGYESGEFDVHPNGSLIINNVLPNHDIFTVAYIHTKKEIPLFIDVRIITVVKPEISYPVINLCNNSRTCYSRASQSSVKCSVSEVRPQVNLRLFSRSTYDDKNVSSKMSMISEGEVYTSSVVSTDVFHYSPLLALLVCKVSSIPGMMQHTESLILLQKDNHVTPSRNVTLKYVEQYKEAHLRCSENNIGFAVWKKTSLNRLAREEVLLYSIFIGEMFTEILSEDVSMDSEGSLLIHRVGVKDEGRYECTFGDGLSEGVASFDINVFVSPVPSYPTVMGCDRQQYCVLKVPREGNLTCIVKGIRPNIKLEWRTFYKDDAHAINFTHQQSTFINNGDTFDVTLITFYTISDDLPKKLLLECKVSTSDEVFRHITSKIHLQFEDGKHSASQICPQNRTNSLSWTIPVIVVLLCLLLVSGVLMKTLIRKRKKLETIEGNSTEMTRMFESENPSGKCDVNVEKLQFINHVREHYMDLCGVQPIPYSKHRLYSVNDVFIDGGVEFLNLSEGSNRRQWISLSSYKNIFDDPKCKSKRRILEAEHGCGKSTTALQLAYDWYTSAQESPLKDVEILILLRLSQLGGIKSIYSAIKQTILPRDSNLSEDSIKDLLLESDSVLIIFDGFDEYADRNNNEFDVNVIIANQMFRDFDVVLTTKTFALPNNFPSSAKRFKLTQWDDNTRRRYINKAVTMDDENDAMKIEDYLKENRLLHELCAVTLRFVLFVHTKYETDNCEDTNAFPNYSTKDIIDYTNSFDESDKLAILCILGVTEKNENINEVLQQLFDEGVIISAHDHLLVQRMYFQLLEIAAAKQIPIRSVILYNCLQSVDLSTAAIRTTSGLALTSRIPVKDLKVSLFNREMTEDEAIAITEFSSHCSLLKFLRFGGSVPQSFKVDSTLATLKSRNVQVEWWMFSDDPKYILNLETGRWQTDGKEPTTAEFENMRSRFHRIVGIKTDEIHKRDIRRIRESLRPKKDT